jgi:hypothetical protein
MVGLNSDQLKKLTENFNLNKETCHHDESLLLFFTMKSFGVILILMLVFGCSSPANYSPEAYLDPVKKDEIIGTLVRYTGKLPKKVEDSQKFDSRYDSYYQELASKHRLMKYHIAEDGSHYFLIRRPAPSLVEKYVASGGRMKFDESGSLEFFEETFRTWKMVPDTLERRASLLFDKMVKGESLDPYLAQNSKIEFIEFPDENVFYDKDSRTWKSKQFGSVEEMTAN